MAEPSGTRTGRNVQSEGYPACSARAAKCEMCCGLAHAPETGRPNPILIAPSLAARKEGVPAATRQGPSYLLVVTRDRHFGCVSAGHLPETSGLARTVEVAVPPNLAKSAFPY